MHYLVGSDPPPFTSFSFSSFSPVSLSLYTILTTLQLISVHVYSITVRSACGGKIIVVVTFRIFNAFVRIVVF